MRNVIIRWPWEWVTRALDWMTAPHPSIQEPQDRRKAQLLATLIIALVPISIISNFLISFRFRSGNLPHSDGTGVALLIVLLTVIVYILSRSPYYVIGATLAVAVASFGVFFTVFFSRAYGIHFLGYLIIPVVLSNIFISVRFTTLMLGLYVVLSGLLAAWVPGIVVAEIVSGPLLQVLVVSIILIITNRYRNLLEKDRRSALEQSEKRYRLVSELMSDYAYSVRILPDGGTQAEWITGAFTEITGYTAEEILQRKGTILAHPDDAEITRARLEQLKSGEVDVREVRILTKDGGTRWLRDYGRPFWDEAENRVVSIYGAAKDITQQRQTEEQLQLLAKAIDEAEEGIFITTTAAENDDMTIVFASGGVLRMTGYTLKEIIGHSPSIWYGPATDQTLVSNMQERVRKGQPAMEELVSYRKDGSHYIVEWYCSPVTNHNDEITHFVFIQRDITARKQAEAAEREQRILAEALRDSAAALTSTLDLNEVLNSILVSVGKVVPHSAGSIMFIEGEMGKVARYHMFGDFNYQNDNRNFFAFKIAETPTLQHMYETGKPLLIPDVNDFPGWKSFEEGRWVRSYIGVPIKEGDTVIGFLNLDSDLLNGFTLQDMENLKAFANQASSALRNARLYNELEQRVNQRTAELDNERKQLQVILDSMGDGMYYTENSVIRYVNQTMLYISGYTQEQLIGKPVLDLVSDENEETPQTIQQQIIATITRQQVWREEIKLNGEANRVFDAGLTVSLVSEPGQKPMRAVTLVRDVSQEKALENRKNRFISTASHELRTPITNITTRLYLIKRQPEKQTEHLRVIEAVTQRMKRLAEDLLDMSRLEHGQLRFEFERVALRELIEPVIDTQNAEAELKQISLSADLPQSPLHIRADRERMAQVITNLITNAVNYTPPDGKVGVVVKAVQEADSEARFVEISVVDSGVGIAHEHLPHIFDTFYRIDEKVKGSGLGLSISREIVEQHGGQMSVESELGKGSCFIIRLPLLP